MDGLLENDSVLRLREHSTDTHGYIEDLFGLCYLLGYSFMPRIRDLADQQLYRIDRDAVYPNLAGIFRGGVDVDLIPSSGISWYAWRRRLRTGFAPPTWSCSD